MVGPAKKRYDHPVIESIFTSAKEALERADEIVFAGFSLSSGDEKIGELLRKAHEIAHTTRVTIIDPKASELASRFEAIYGTGVEYTLENDWLEYLRGPSY